MSGDESSTPPAFSFELGTLTFVDQHGQATRIEAENITKVTAFAYSPPDELVELTIESRTPDGIFVVQALNHPFAFEGLGLCLARYPGFDFDWPSKLSANETTLVYRTYPDPIV